MATAPQNMQQGLKHDGSLACEICETLQWDREPSIDLSHNEGQTRSRRIGQCLQFQRCPVVCANPSFVSQQPDCTGRSPIGDGRSSVLGLRGFGPTRMKGLMQSRQLSLIALPNPVPLVCLHLHRSMRIK